GETGKPEKLLDLGRKGGAACARHDVERLDPKPVPRGEEPLSLVVPHEEREHAEKADEAGLAPGRVGGEQDLAVTLRGERVPFGLQFLAQLDIIVDLAVENEVKPAARVGHGLQSGVRYVDDREAAMAERDRTGRGRELAPARAVRPTMRHDVDSRPDRKSTRLNSSHSQ